MRFMFKWHKFLHKERYLNCMSKFWPFTRQSRFISKHVVLDQNKTILKLYSLMPPQVERWHKIQDDPLVPSFASSAFDEKCRMNARSCGISSRSVKKIPILQGHLDLASVCEDKHIVLSCCFFFLSDTFNLPSNLWQRLLDTSLSVDVYNTIIFCADLYRCSCRDCTSLARSNQPSPTVYMVHLLSWDPSLRFVIRRNGHSILPACKVHTQNECLSYKPMDHSTTR